jgi:hypothetical protein
MHRNIFQSALAALLISFGFLSSVGATPVEGLLGRWIAQEPIPGRDVIFNLAFNFCEDRTEMQVNCVYRTHQSLTATAVAQTVYDGNEIYLQENNENVVNDGFRFCRATLMPAQWEALFDGLGNMVLFIPAPYQSRLTLVRAEQPPVPLR